MFASVSKSLGRHCESVACKWGDRRWMRTVAVIGCGLMGSGIGQTCAQAGYHVRMVDESAGAAEKALERVRASVERVAKKKYASGEADEASKRRQFVQDTMGAITVGTDAAAAAAEAHIVIEAIVENIEAKNRLFQILDEAAPASCIFASNTSSLSIEQLATATKRQDRFGGLHFFNPVPVMALVEIVSTPHTSAATTEALVQFAQSLGKVPVRCRDTPGFIVNRLLVPYLIEAVRMLERGDAAARDIDEAMRLGAGHPMGPLALADYVGLDTVKFIVDGWRRAFPGDPRFAPVALLDRLVGEGKLGHKTGRGFYEYPSKPGTKRE